ncbi:hypothetical protein WKI71_07335 [Streptomyces sp. MS1.AVA.1]|uniref:Uncharacterized protein n=1 Tax=Streptomyces machairae TaxID=3134109 RepID=A0ABU8UHM1_9ACTN
MPPAVARAFPRRRPRAAPPGPGVEIAPGAPAEHGLGQQHFETALEVAELLGGVTAVAALRQMLLDIGQQGSAPANGDI